jgi:hypothetical protein
MHGRYGFKIVLMAVLVVCVSVYVIVLTRNSLKQYQYIGRSDQQTYTISITGEGKVTATPDIARVTLGVQTEKAKVIDAQKDADAKMAKLNGEIKQLGVDEKDIQTSAYTIYPQYDYRDGTQVLRGYQVNESVVVKLRGENLDKLGTLIEAAGRVGANQVGDLNFTIDDPEVLSQQARVKALENALSKANELAKVAGVKLGKLVSFNEWTASPAVPMYREFSAVASDGFGGGSAPTIQPGSQEVVVNVNVTYEVQ